MFEEEGEDIHRFLIRGAVAYGPVIDGQQVMGGHRVFQKPDNLAYLNNILIGSPVAWAYDAECKAPPFGVYVDQSVTTFSPESISWVLHRWWDTSKSSEVNWAKEFGERVLEYLSWCKEHSRGSLYPVDKHDKYTSQAKEYFDV